MARDSELARVDIRIERTPRTALVEVCDDEVVLECAIEVPEKGALGCPWSSMEPDNDGSTPVLTAGQQEELGAIDGDSFRGGDRALVGACAT